MKKKGVQQDGERLVVVWYREIEVYFKFELAVFL
jgi:hypothetical protein